LQVVRFVKPEREKKRFEKTNIQRSIKLKAAMRDWLA